MARTVRVGEFQNMQRASKAGPNHVALGESAATGDAETGSHDVAAVDPLTGQVVDAAAVIADAAEANATGREWASDGDMASQDSPRARDLVTLSAADELGERLAGRSEAMAGKLGRGREYDVEQGGTVRDWRRPDNTPDRGPDVGTTVHQVTDADPRFSGAGASDAVPFGSASDKIPTDAQFTGRLYREAPELANIAEELIGRHGFLEELVNCEIRFFWRRKTGVSKGRVKIGYCKRASDLLGHFTGCDFIIWLSATTARDGRFTDRQIEAAVFHQLCHIEVDDEGNFISARHDFEGFAQEVRHYGTWTEGLKLGGQSFVAAHQMGLFDAIDEDEDDEDPDAVDTRI